MTVRRCVTQCRARGYAYAGLEYGEECYCGSAGTRYDRYGEFWDSACQHPCSGYPSERCGGIGRIAVYVTNATAPSTELPSTVTTPSPTAHAFNSTKALTLSISSTLKTTTITVLHETRPATTTKDYRVHTDGIDKPIFDDRTSEEMKYLAVIMGSLLFVGVLVTSCILVWNFKLRSRMRAIQDSPLHSSSDGCDTPPPHDTDDKKVQLVYSDLLTTDITDNHYESLITSAAMATVADEAIVVTRPRKKSTVDAQNNDRYSNYPARVPTYFPQPDIYENYRYSYMQ